MTRRCGDALIPHYLVRREMKLRHVLAAAISLAQIGSARALDFDAIPVENGTVIISVTGEINPGDRDKFLRYLASLPSNKAPVGIALSSRGGNVFEAEDFAITVRALRLGVLVSDGSLCASSCFLLFAAARTKLVGSTARIGVHSANLHGAETLQTMGLTTAMARDAAAYGVPPAILGRMVETTPDRIEWLSSTDLISMGATVLPPAASASAEPPAGQAPQSLYPVTPKGGGDVTASAAQPVVPPSTPSPAFQQGLADRGAWETWYSSSSGDFHSGVDFWAEQRSTAKQSACLGPPGQHTSDWTAGCLAAQQRIAPFDYRRKREPDYKAGWNSY